jgi:hypothetical protein
MRATYTRTEGVRHLLAAYDLGEDRLYGHVKPHLTRTRFLEFCRYLRPRKGAAVAGGRPLALARRSPDPGDAGSPASP